MLKSVTNKTFSGDIEFYAFCVATIYLVAAEIIVYDMLVKLIKLHVFYFSLMCFRLSEVIMVK